MDSKGFSNILKKMRGFIIAAALYLALSFATYDGTISPKTDSPAIRRGNYADQIIYGSNRYGSSGAYSGDDYR
jgi:hypothetical protein